MAWTFGGVIYLLKVQTFVGLNVVGKEEAIWSIKQTN